MSFNLPYLQTSKRRTLKGMAFPMSLDGVGGYVTANENLGTLRDGIIQLIMTGRGSRVMRPTYGTDLRASVFEPLDDTLVRRLQKQIAEVIAKYEPRVVVKSLTVVPILEENKLNIRLSISTKDNLNDDTLIDIII